MRETLARRARAVKPQWGVPLPPLPARPPWGGTEKFSPKGNRDIPPASPGPLHSGLAAPRTTLYITGMTRPAPAPSLDLAIPSRLSPAGRPPKPVAVDYLGPLTEADILLIFTGEAGVRAKPLQKIRAAHHNVAILLSQGHTSASVSRITGYSPSRIALLKEDPAFKQLLAHYSQMGEQATADFFQQLADLGIAAVQELQERLETDPDNFSPDELIKIVEKTSDRTGFGPTKTVKSLNVSTTISKLKERMESKGQVLSPDET